jgi:hypothetical protein
MVKKKPRQLRSRTLEAIELPQRSSQRRVIRARTWEGTSGPAAVGSRKGQKAVPARSVAGRRQRTAAEAARRGISVEQLVAERRAAAADDLRLHDEAVSLGITVKELRRRRTRPQGG